MSEKLVSNITRLTYELNSYNFMLNDDGNRKVYEIYKNGHCSLSSYNGEEEAEDEGKTVVVDKEVVKQLFKDLCDLLQNAEHVHHYMDDKTATLTIHLNGGDMTLPRGLSTDSISLNRIMTNFIEANY